MTVKGAKGKAGNIVVWVILALLIVGLAGFGATNFGGGVGRIGKVGETEIGIDDYALALQQELRRFSEQTGQQITLEQGRSFGIDQMVLQRLVGRAALDDEAGRIGLSVGDDQVAQEIRGMPAFEGINGEFDRESYEFVLERNGLNPARFEEQVRADTARNLLQGAIAGGVKVPATYVATLYGFAREGRDVTWAVLTPGDLDVEIPAPTEDDLVAYHAENPEPFTAPESRVVTYAWITPDMLAEEIETDDDILRQLYEDRADEFRQPERRIVERLIFGSEEEAQTAADAIAANETTFDALVAERGLSLGDVDMGDVSRGELDDAADVVFALEEPGVAGPAPSGLGPALFRVNAILAASETTFEEVREDLAIEAELDQARRVIDDMEQQIEDLLAGGATLEELAEETELELGSVTLGPESTDGPAAYDEFRVEANAVVEGDYPELRRIEDGGLFALRLDEVREPQVRPFEEVRDAVEATWQAARVREALMARAEAAAEGIGGGATFEDEGLETGTAAGITRDGFIEGAPEDAVSTIFEMAPGEARAVAADQGAMVIRLDTVTAAEQDDAEATAAKAAFAEQSASGLADDILAAFVRATERDAGISLDQNAINAVHTQLP